MAVALAGLLLAIVGGTKPATVIVGLGVAVCAGTVGALAWRHAAPARETVSGSWWKFVVAGPCLIAVVIIAAGMGVQAWFLGVACVFTAFVLIAIGLVLGLSHLLNRRIRGISA
jgi:hypothetical protein